MGRSADGPGQTAKTASAPAAARTASRSRPGGRTLPVATRAGLDRAIDAVRAGARSWPHLTLDQRARLFERIRGAVSASAEEWVDRAARSKGLDESHPLFGEEWLSGPYAVLRAIDGYVHTLRRLAKGASPLDGVRMDAAPGGRLRAHVFPSATMDRILLSGYTGEVWFQPGTTPARARDDAGLAQRRPAEDASLALVLGAGNVTSIPVLDVFYQLLAGNRVSVLKLNPTQDVLIPVLQRALAPLIEPGYLRIVPGDAGVGAYLSHHEAFAHVHVTGSIATFDAIVWGSGSEAERRRRTADSRLAASISAELGGVSPIIVVPGRWSGADLRYQASHIATMRLNNSGHNCIAGQVVIISRDWDQRDAFLAALRAAYEDSPDRPVWYPGSDRSLAAAAQDDPGATWLAGGTRALVVHTDDGPSRPPMPVEQTEYFAPVLGVVELAGTGGDFLEAAIRHANERLAGTLGANVLIDPETERDLGDRFERMIAELRYGAIAINAWTGVVFATPVLTWGAFPGGTISAVGSGLGVVHNTLLCDHVERSVMRGPFRPFPRSWGRHGRRSLLPKPPWFVDSRTGTAVSEGLTRWHMHRRVPALLSTLVKALGS